MPRALLQEIERKVLRFLTPITWAKLGMFSAVGALYGTQLFLQDLRLSNVASVLSTHEAWSDIRRGTISALDFFGIQSAQKSCPTLAIVVQNDFFVLYQRLAGAELHRWETYSERTLGALLSRWRAQGAVAVQLRNFEVYRDCLAGTEEPAQPSEAGMSDITAALTGM